MQQAEELIELEMTIFKQHEKQVIDLLTRSHLSDEQRQKLELKAVLVDCYQTGAGYFLTVSHDDLPVERTVCNEPQVIGNAEGIESGFLIFLENQELTIECHSWEENVPDDYRELNVAISVQS